MVNVGIIGCGGMGKLHSRSLKAIEGVRLAAACDIDAQALEAYAKEFSPARTYSDFGALVRDPGVDAVVVCLPTYVHKDAVLAAAAAGKQVFCEKPIALSEADAQEMIDACSQAGVILMLGFVRRFDNDWGTFKRLVEEGAIGRPVVWRHFMAGGGPHNSWFIDGEKGGGPIIDGAIHDLDFANWLFGPMAWCQGSARHFKSTSWDTVTVTIGYESGDELVLSWCWGLPKGAGGLHGQDAIGPGGTIFFPHSVPSGLVPADVPSDEQGAYWLDTGEEKKPVLFQKHDMFLVEMEHFIDCCANGKQPVVTGEDGLKAIRVALQSLASARKL